MPENLQRQSAMNLARAVLQDEYAVPGHRTLACKVLRSWGIRAYARNESYVRGKGEDAEFQHLLRVEEHRAAAAKRLAEVRP